MLPIRSLLLPLLVTCGVASAHAQSDQYHITAAEQAACFSDASRLCSDAYPDEEKLLSCMTRNQSSLSSGCAFVFKAGLKRRHLP